MPTPTPPPPGRGLGVAIAVVVSGLIVGAGAVALILPHWLASPPTGETAPSAATADTRKIHAVLFYVSDDGSELIQVSREVPFGETPVDQARRIVEAQVAIAPAGFTSAIPPGTTVRSVLLDDHGTAYVDLSRDVVTGHTGGSLDEALTVFSIVNAITVNLPDIPAVQLLIDGHAVDTLVGHLDLRHPLGRSLQWVRKGQ
ncbi:MAG TPA: GerMN domain-containing protein [Vicinamibacterales bacterium]